VSLTALNERHLGCVLQKSTICDTFVPYSFFKFCFLHFSLSNKGFVTIPRIDTNGTKMELLNKDAMQALKIS
jgi:hypothetical protein